MKNKIKEKYLSLFEKKPLLIGAPGRINLIGEHTDYNEGFVLPAAINKQIIFAVSGNDKKQHRFFAVDLNDSIEIPVDSISPVEKKWANYLLGVIAQLEKKGIKIPGVDCVFGGDIPLGAGLSSSAALETGFAFALNQIFDLKLTKLEIVQLSQIAEHEYAGVMCGIMDQFASVFGEKNKVIRLDCRSLESEMFPIDLPQHKIILCDTQVEHALASSEYNNRRKECETGVTVLQKYHNDIHSLRDVTIEMLNEHQSEMDPVVYKRCKYVVEENQRLLEACDALAAHNLNHFGELMYSTHKGLKDDYKVSCKELDLLVDIAKESGVVLGSRMMGGGFGGCTINIVEKKNVNSFIKKAVKEYASVTGITLNTYIVDVENGTHIIE